MHDSHHGHNHSHDHNHNHTHDHAHSEGSQTAAVLTYMLEHNRHHAEELEQLVEKLAAEGHSGAAALLKQGVQDFNNGNEKLAAVLDKIKEV